jgi:hypothetical protein
VTRTIKRTIRLGGKFAFPVCANGGEGKQFVALSDYEKPLVTKIIVNSVGGKFADRPGINSSRPGCGEVVTRLAARDHTRS